jgi:hypothetical protein
MAILVICIFLVEKTISTRKFRLGPVYSRVVEKNAKRDFRVGVAKAS